MKNIIGPVVTDDDFFARKETLESIANALNRGDHILLSAPRRVGKTSLLRNLVKNESIGVKYIYIDVESAKDIISFYQIIYKSITGDKKQINKDNYLTILGDVIKNSNTKVVILIDEFGYFLENQKRIEQDSYDKIKNFLEELRYFRLEYKNLRLVLTIEDYEEISEFRQVLNDFHIIKINDLTFKEAKQFIQSLAKEYNLNISEKLIEYILKKVDWYLPFILQLLFSKLRERTYGINFETFSQAEVDGAIENFLKNDRFYIDSLLRTPKNIPLNSTFARKLVIKKCLDDLGFEETSNKYTVEKDIIKYSLKSLIVDNFRGIKFISISHIPVDSNWIFLIGENGYGKTTLLQSISLALFGLIDDVQDLDYLSEKSQIGIEFLNNYENELKYCGMFDYSFPHLACYGPSRLQIQTDQTQNDIAKKSTTTYSLFNSDGILLNIEFELLIWHLEKNPRFDAVKQTFLKLIPYLYDIEVDVPQRKIFYIEKEPTENGSQYNRVTFNQLASGFRSILAMVGDMMIRLFKSQPEITEPSELAGIVIIDELDLHWHPKMQREIPSLLSSIFPKVQFIASTHSLVPLLGAPENSVLLKVNRTVEEGITVENVDIDFQALSSDTMLRDIFDLEEYMSDPKIKAWERYKELKRLIRAEENIDKKEIYMDERREIGNKYTFPA